MIKILADSYVTAWLDISATESEGNVNNCYTFHDFDKDIFLNNALRGKQNHQK